jgi:hypothetical protein
MRRAKAAALSLAMVLAASKAWAGVYTDAMSKCLVKSTSAEDKVHLMRWLFLEISMNPVVKSVASATPEQRVEFEKEGATLFQRLVLVDCRKETIDALKHEGAGAIQNSFAVLGEVAGKALMDDPSVNAGLMAMTSYLDKDRWQALSREAGFR